MFIWCNFAGFLSAQNILVQCKRFRGKINIQRPRQPFYEKALFDAVTRPIYKPDSLIEECREKEVLKLQRTQREHQTHPYQTILARELFERLDTAKMIILCQPQSYTNEEIFKTRVALHQKAIEYKVYGKAIVTEAIAGTKFEAMIPLFDVRTAILYSKEVHVAHTFKVLRKFPQLIVLAGVVEDRLLSKNELVNYSNLQNIQTVRAQFAASLNAPGNSIVTSLQAHQSNLCYLLEAYAKSLREAKVEAPTDVQEPATKTEN